MQKSSFFDTTPEDPREYPAREFAEYFARFVGNGIFGGGTTLKVGTSTGLKVSVALGYGWINGYMYSLYDAPETLTLDAAAGADRIDRIVLRLDTSISKRSVVVAVKKGTSATAPPALTRAGDVYELSLAQVIVRNGSATISGADITDERLDNTVCGIVTGVIEQADTTTIFNQFQSWYSTKTAAYQSDWSGWFTAAKATFEAQWQAWMDGLASATPVLSVNGKGGTVVLVPSDIGAAPLASPAFTGNPTVPTQTPGTNNTRAASTAYADAAVAAHIADYIRQPGYGTTAGSANAYTLTLSPALSAYAAGVCVAIKIHVANTGASTININGLGAKSILDSKGNAMTSGKLRLNGVYTLRYDGTAFILQGEGGEYGTATAADVRASKTLGTDSGVVNGSLREYIKGGPGTITDLPDWVDVYTGVVDVRITQEGFIPAGSYIRAVLPTLDPSNIKNGVVIGTGPGAKITGTYFAKNFASGVATSSGSGLVSVSGLTFTPKLVLVKLQGGLSNHQFSIVAERDFFTSPPDAGLSFNYGTGALTPSYTLGSGNFAIQVAANFAQYPWIALG
ncbi:MAG: hypothetical protein J7559_02620 [Cohnella sp.]|nr:hypothetical protein [Cohnella sp.]